MLQEREEKKKRQEEIDKLRKEEEEREKELEEKLVSKFFLVNYDNYVTVLIFLVIRFLQTHLHF